MITLTPGMSIAEAVANLPDGGDIYLEPGEYSKPTVTARPSAMVYLHATGAVVPGAALRGARNLTIRGGRWHGKIVIESRAGLTNPPENVTLNGIESSAGGIELMNAARNFRLLNSHLHDAARGVHGPGRIGPEYASQDIVIKGNLIERMAIDGIAFGDWNDVEISDNTIRDLDGSDTFHNDGIQLYGGSRDVTIANNRIKRSSGQGILVQASIRPIHGVTLAHNVVQDTFAVAVVFERATGCRIEHNAIHGGPNSDGGLWLGGPAQDYVSAYNTITSGQAHMTYRKLNGGATAVDIGNAVA